MNLIPVWNGLAPQARKGFQEFWHIKFTDPVARRAFYLHFGILSSTNGFRRIAEVTAILYQRKDNKEVTKSALKQTLDLREFSTVSNGSGPGVRVGACELTANHTRGAIQSKGRELRWNLAIASAQDASFNLIPEALSRSGLVKNSVVTMGEHLAFTGTTELEGEKQEWTATAGILGHQSGTHSGHSWIWGHCNTFVNEQGKPVSFIFDGLSTRTRVAGPIPSPRLSSFYFNYLGEEYRFNSLWDVFRSRSHHTLTEWKFQAEKGDLMFKGEARAEHRDFAGLTSEDTDGSFLYCADTQLADLMIAVYRKGKLEAVLKSAGSASLEVVTRHRNPYVPLLV